MVRSRLVVSTGLGSGVWYNSLHLSVSVSLAQLLSHEQRGPTSLLAAPSAGHWKSFCSQLFPKSDLPVPAPLPYPTIKHGHGGLMVKQLLSWGVCCAAGLNPLSWSSFLSPGLPVWALFKLRGGGIWGTKCHSPTSKKQKQKKMFAFVCETSYGWWCWGNEMLLSPVRGRLKETMHVAF